MDTEVIWKVFSLLPQVITVAFVVLGWLVTSVIEKLGSAPSGADYHDLPGIKRELPLVILAALVFLLTVGVLAVSTVITMPNLIGVPINTHPGKLLAAIVAFPGVVGLIGIIVLHSWLGEVFRWCLGLFRSTTTQLGDLQRDWVPFSPDRRFQPSQRLIIRWAGNYQRASQMLRTWQLGRNFLNQNRGALVELVHTSLDEIPGNTLSADDFVKLEVLVRTKLDRALKDKRAHLARDLTSLQILAGAACYMYLEVVENWRGAD